MNIIFTFAPLAKDAFLRSPNGDFSWSPSYEDGADYPRFMDKWVLCRVSFAISRFGGNLELAIHQMFPDGAVVKFVLEDDVTEDGLSKIINELNQKCLLACCRYLAFVRVTKSDPIRFIGGMAEFDLDRVCEREADYLEAVEVLFGTKDKFSC